MGSDTEIWRPTIGWPLYEVSDQGRVRSITRKVRTKGGFKTSKSKILKQRLNRGYPAVFLYRDQKMKFVTVHKLVLEAFVGPKPSEEMQARHLDGNKEHNKPRNLVWGTSFENHKDRKKHGTDFSSLSGDQILDVMRTPKTYGSGAALARKYGVSQSTISTIRSPRTYFKAMYFLRPIDC